MNYAHANKSLLCLALAAALATPGMAQEITTFTNGTVANAQTVNANFNAVKTRADNAKAAADTAQATADAAQASADSALTTAAAAQAGINTLSGPIGVAGGDVGITTRVGILTTQPGEALDVNGNIRMRFGNRLYFADPNYNGDPIYFERFTGATEESVITLVVGDDGNDFDRFNVSAGGGTKFSFWGNGIAYKNGGGSWTALSDARKKRDIRPLEGALDRLMRLNGKTYRYRNPEELGAAPGICTGFIAQEVEKVFPKWVSEDKNGIKSVTVYGFEALAVEAMRELKSTNDTLVADNADLRDANSALLDRLEALEQAVAQLQPTAAAGK